EAGADAADDGGVERGSRDDDLAFGEGGQVVEQVAADAFDGGGYAFLIDFVDDAHDALGLALAEYIGVELAGALADEADADAEFASFGQDLFENGGRDDVGAAGGEVVRLFEEDEDGIGQVEFARVDFAALGLHARFVETAQDGGDDDLLVALVDVVELQDGALARLEYFGEVQVLEVVEGVAVLETVFDTPGEGMDGAAVVGSLAILVTFLFGDGLDGLLEIGRAPGGAPFGFVDFAQGAVEQVLLLFSHFGEQVA